MRLVARVAAAISGARFVTVPGCGHFAFMAAPAQFRRHGTDLLAMS